MERALKTKQTGDDIKEKLALWPRFEYHRKTYKFIKLLIIIVNMSLAKRTRKQLRRREKVYKSLSVKMTKVLT